jgi:hypothetical protein
VHQRTLIALNATAGVAAIGGMAYALGGARGVPIEWLEGSPFADYKVPGLILGGVYAPASLAAAWALANRHPRAGDVALAAAAVQVGWIAGQVSIIGFRSIQQPLWGGVGLVDLALVWRLRRGHPRTAGRRLAPPAAQPG